MGCKISAIQYNWNDHACYIGKISYKDLINLVDNKTDISMNRKIDGKRVKEIKQYILDNISDTFFPPTILNSKATISYEAPSTLNVKSGNFTIIDGQHRITAIIELLEDAQSQEKQQLKIMELPVMIIEGLENYQHRDLFYMINETPKNVESNVSERFAPKLENLLALKFFSVNKQLVHAIEWHEKQSKEKIVYIHMTDCIRELNRVIYPALKDWYDCERELIYKEDSYTDIIIYYWNTYFDMLENTSFPAFFRKKITLRALVEDVFIKIDNLFNEQSFNPSTREEAIDAIKQTIYDSLNSLIHDPLIEYKGSENVKKDIFRSIRHSLNLNYKLREYEEEIQTHPNIKILIDKVIQSFYINNMLLLSESDVQFFQLTLNDIITKRGDINRIDQNELELVLVNKQTTLEQILEQFSVRE